MALVLPHDSGGDARGAAGSGSINLEQCSAEVRAFLALNQLEHHEGEEGEGERIRGRGEEGIAEVEGEGCLESALLAGEKTRWCFNGLYI